MCTSVSTPPISLIRSGWLPAFLTLATFTIFTTLAVNALAGEIVTIDGVPHIQNPATPRDGVESMRLEERWRAGGEDDEMFFGVVNNVIADDADNLYLLDMQLSEVQVYSADGEWQRTLSREGEGPGEVRRPRQLLFMPDGTLGIVQMFPGKIIKIDLQGNPAGSLTPGDDPTAGGFGGLDDVRFRDGHLVCCGSMMTQTDDGFLRTEYLASFHEDGKEKVRFMEKSNTPDFAKPQFNEKEEYFVSRGRWVLGPGGRIYAATERDKYAVHVYSPDGKLERVIEREMEPWKRTKEEYDRVGEGMVIIANGRRLEIEKNIEDYAPSIERLRVTDDGYLWVLSSRSTREQPDGIFQTYDVFDPDGHFVKQVAVACEGSSQEDSFFLLNDDMVVVVRGAVDAIRTMFGNSGHGADEADEEDTAEEDAEPLEVIVYRIVS